MVARKMNKLRPKWDLIKQLCSFFLQGHHALDFSLSFLILEVRKRDLTGKPTRGGLLKQKRDLFFFVKFSSFEKIKLLKKCPKKSSQQGFVSSTIYKQLGERTSTLNLFFSSQNSRVFQGGCCNTPFSPLGCQVEGDGAEGFASG